MKEERVRLTQRVELDGRTFRRFALFDAFRREGRWRRPALFVCLMLGFSCACLAGGSLLLASVFCIIGLGLPSVWIGTFLFQVNTQARRLDSAHATYDVTMEEDGVSGPGLEAPLPWTQVHAAHLARDCLYLYVTPLRAILIPSGTADFEELISLLAQYMPGKITSLFSGTDASSAGIPGPGRPRQ